MLPSSDIDSVPHQVAQGDTGAQEQQNEPAAPVLEAINTSYPYPNFLRNAPAMRETSYAGDVLSTASSPTTTNDVTSVNGSSPSTSPESPNAATFGAKTSEGVRPTVQSSDSPVPPTPTLSLSSDTPDDSPISPGKRARNSKNLTLKMGTSMRAHIPPAPPRVLTKVLDTVQSPQSAPQSPSFILPPKPARRRPNVGLSISPPAAGAAAERNSKGLTIVPPTPSTGISVSLRHHQSTPTLSIPNSATFSPISGPRNHLQMLPGLRPPPTPRNPSALKHSFPSDQALSPLSFATTSSFNRLAQLSEEPTDSEISSNGKPAAYPEGPVCIYEPGVYLYLEPNQEEASGFDVIMNVAKEVKNPFELVAPGEIVSSRGPAVGTVFAGPAAAELASPVVDRQDKGPESVFVFDRNPPIVGDQAAPQITKPEYIHIPWDHHTAIVSDLLRLVQLIDERVGRGKRVLIHCQCGVSRSASLIIAYGLYKNPNLSVTEAYDAVKQRSQWIGPNMNLIYQLNEFKTLLQRMGSGPQSGPRSWMSGSGSRGLGSGGRSSTFSHSQPGERPLIVQNGLRDPEPLTAPLPDNNKERPTSMMESRKSPKPLAIAVPPQLPAPSNTPASAPPGMSWMPFSPNPASSQARTVPMHAPSQDQGAMRAPNPDPAPAPQTLSSSVYVPPPQPQVTRQTAPPPRPTTPPHSTPQLSRYYAEIAQIPPSPPANISPPPPRTFFPPPPIPESPPRAFATASATTATTPSDGTRNRIAVIRPSRSFVLNRKLHLKTSNPSLNSALSTSEPSNTTINTATSAQKSSPPPPTLPLPLSLPLASQLHTQPLAEEDEFLPPPTPSILSPREATFQGYPWGPPTAAATAGKSAAGAVDAANFVPLVADPRSPAAQEGGEKGIHRSIWDVL